MTQAWAETMRRIDDFNRSGSASVASFAADLDKLTQRIALSVDDLIRYIVLKALRGIILRTPRDTGMAQASWMVGVDAVTQAVPAAGQQIDAEALAARQAGRLPRNLAGHITYIFSNLPYIEPLEFGHSGQAPAGMVRVTIAEIEAEIEALLS